MLGQVRPDGRLGSGYASLGVCGIGSDNKVEDTWPYATRTKIEDEADSSIDHEEKSRNAINKRNKKHYASDRLQQLNYKTGSFVSGQTRGLTGIMSGVEPLDILEAFVKTTINRIVPKERLKPLGMSAPFSTMSSNMTTRIRPGMTLGSKAGWFGPPPPKDTDPSLTTHVLRLKDVANNFEDRALHNVKVEKLRVKKKNRANKLKVDTLHSYIKFMAGMNDYV